MPLYASGRAAADSRDAAARRARRAREDAGDFRAFGHESVLVFPLQREDELTHLASGHHLSSWRGFNKASSKTVHAIKKPLANSLEAVAPAKVCPRPRPRPSPRREPLSWGSPELDHGSP